MANDGQFRRGCVSGYSVGQEVVPECEVLFEADQDDLENRFRNCVKNPNHTNFFSCSNFRVDDLPPENRTRGMMDEILKRCIQTVRVKVQYISCNRPDVFADSDKPYPFAEFRGSERIERFGTGKVIQVFYPHGVEGKPCPCPLCKNSTRPKKFWWIRVRTATHVIFDRSEAESASFECFYDDAIDVEERKVRTLYGFDTFNISNTSDNIFRSDVCDVLCVTHERDVASLLYKYQPPDSNFLLQTVMAESYAPSKVIVSHPHGCFKRITLGNVLHLTMPISQNFPTNKSLPFKDGTVYRSSTRTKTHGPPIQASSAQQRQDGYSDCHSDEEVMKRIEDGQVKEDRHACNEKRNYCKDDFITSDQYNMKEKLDVIKRQLCSQTSHENLSVEELKDYVKQNDDHEDNGLDKDEYVANFYCIFIRDQILFLFAIFSVFRQKVKNPQSYQCHMGEAFQELNRFLGTEIRSSMSLKDTNSDTQTTAEIWNTRTDSKVTDESVDRNMFGMRDSFEGSSPTSTDRDIIVNDENDERNRSVTHEFDYAIALLDELVDACEKGYARYKSQLSSFEANSGNNIFFVSLFIECDKIVDSARMQMKQTRKHFDENILPLLLEQVFEATLNVFEKFEAKLSQATVDNKTSEHCFESSRTAKETNELQSNTRTDSNNISVEKEENLRKTKALRAPTQNKGQNANDDVQKMNHVPIGSSFLLPPDAEYAFRAYNETPGWISFPPGTKMIQPDGQVTINEIGEPLYEFKVDFFVPEQSYVTYDIATCPGSSGATVHCEHVLGKNINPIFPHSGYLEEKGHNRSGVRHSVYSVYSKLLMSDSTEIMQCMRRSNAKPSDVPSLLEVSRALVMKLKLIFTKSVGK